LHDLIDHVGAGRVDEEREFLEMSLGGLLMPGREGDADEHDSFPERAIDEAGTLASELSETAAMITDDGEVVVRHPVSRWWRCVARVR
jgi:hypothetical protein